ncbi:hypothetical protein [Roseovarius sp. A46]|uniref:hypothetical protein n=1 Tax=Roseovarius sp. A46 TaxID=2109331 RepID=UPI0010100D40|nr:hypothetical protein [Roseovarius sp. A46]
MRGAFDHIGMAIVLGWAGFALAGLWVGPAVASAAGGVVSALVLVLQRSTPVAGAMALLSPLGVMLPALALRDLAAAWGLPVVPFGTAELLIFLAAYSAFLASAMGLVPVDLYRLGYAPWPVAAMVLAVCVYGIVSETLFLPLVSVAGQALWVARLGSSNWFDHVLHAMLMPVAVVVLLMQVF